MHEPPLILVVDDTRSDSMLLSRALGKAGYEFIAAADGDAAILLARERNPDLILLDMTLPGMDGVATCRAIKGHAETSTIPIIFVTAHTDTERVVEAFSAGGADYVTKPIRLEEILARVSVQLRLREAEQRLQNRNRELESLSRRLAEANEELARLSCTDGLTGLLNRRAWDETAAVEVERSLRHGRDFAVLLIDIDHFKGFNDTLGHPAGDACLRDVACSIISICRGSDIVGRYGGEEFVVLAPETSAPAAARLAERIRKGVWGLGLRHPKSAAGRVTVSVGVADCESGSLAEMIHLADVLLYRAKNAGRNLVFYRTTPCEPFAPGPVDFRADDDPAAESSLCAPPATVLVVDDHRSDRLVYRGILEKEGYRVLDAESGQDAIRAVAQEAPDVIIMDVMMPVMGGIECTRRLKEDPDSRDIPIIIVSARNESASILAGLDAGAEDYLTKPVRTTELAARVRSMVRLSIEKKDLLRSYRLRAEQIRFLMLLVEWCQEVGRAESVDALLDRTLEAVAQITSGQRVMVLIPRARGAALVVRRALGKDVGVPPNLTISLRKGPIAAVSRSREGMILNARSLNDAEPGDATCFLKPPLLAVPFGAPPDAQGVLSVSNRVGGGLFEARDLEYVTLMANIASSAMRVIQNGEARDEARHLILAALARLAEHRDSDTGRHVDRVARIACTIARTLRERERFAEVIDDAFLEDLLRAAPLHDIGKVAIPDRVLFKPGKLSLEEMAIMRTHVDIGEQTLRPVIDRVPDAPFLKMALDIVRSHHEWHDGSGYPQGLKGDEIPLSAQIVAIADVYDALTTDRVYRVAMPVDKAERIIEALSSTQFDPDIVAAFRACKKQLHLTNPAAAAPPPEPVGAV